MKFLHWILFFYSNHCFTITSLFTGPRQQMNGITHVFDGSAIYGSTQAEMDNLRAHQGGLMKTQTVNGFSLPPADLSKCAQPQEQRCPFAGGDSRINTTRKLLDK